MTASARQLLMHHALLLTLILQSDTLCLRRSHRHERDSRIRPTKAASKAPVREAPAVSCSLALVDRIVRAARTGLAVFGSPAVRSEEHTSELQSLAYLVC